MNITISCSVFARLAKVARLNTDGCLRSIWLEVKDGKTIAVATDRKIMAIEFISEGGGVDFSMNAVVDDTLIAQCEIEKSFSGSIDFEFNPALNWTYAKTSFGYVHGQNAALVGDDDKNVLHRWRGCLPDKLPKITTGGMFTNVERLAVLASSSPSGMIIFPEQIDVDKPVVVNDVHDPNWLGVFLSKPGNNSTPDPVTIPGWAR